MAFTKGSQHFKSHVPITQRTQGMERVCKEDSCIASLPFQSNQGGVGNGWPFSPVMFGLRPSTAVNTFAKCAEGDLVHHDCNTHTETHEGPWLTSSVSEDFTLLLQESWQRMTSLFLSHMLSIPSSSLSSPPSLPHLLIDPFSFSFLTVMKIISLWICWPLLSYVMSQRFWHLCRLSYAFQSSLNQ